MSSKPGSAHLARALGVRDVALFMVTAGCSLQWAAIAAAAGPSSLVVWVLGGLAMFLPLSVCVVFLSSRYPDEGGLYVWSKRAFGPFAGFMAGWTYWTSNLPFLPSMLYFAAGSSLYWSGGHGAVANASPGYFIGFSVTALGIAVALNLRGLKVAKWLNNGGAVARWVLTILVVALAFSIWRRFGSATPINRQTIVPSFHLTDLIFWGTIAFAWTGPEAASFMGGEIRDPRRTVPRALAIAAPMIITVYLVGTASLLIAAPPERTTALYGLMEAIRSAALRLDMSWLIPVAVITMILEIVGSVGVWLGAVARIPFVAGIDRYLPRSFAKLHPRFGVPTTAIWTQALIIALLAIMGQAGTSVRGAYSVLVEMMVIATMLPFVPLFASAIKLSAGAPVPGEARIPGGRVTVVTLALIGLATTVGAMALAFVPPADEVNPALAAFKIAGMTAVLLLAGAIIYFVGRARARRLDHHS